VTAKPTDTPSAESGDIRLQEDFPLSRVEYLALEEGLSRILQRPGRTWNDRLVAGEVFLGMLADYLLATASRQDERTRSGTLRHYVDRMTEESSDRLFRIAARIRPNRHVRNLVLSLFRVYQPGRNTPSDGIIQRLRTAFRLLAGVAPLPRKPRSFPGLDENEGGILMESVVRVVSRGGLLDGPSPYFTRVVRRGYAHLIITAASALREWDPRLPSGLRRDRALEAAQTLEQSVGNQEEDREGITVEERISRSRIALHILDSCIHRKDFTRSLLG